MCSTIRNACFLVLLLATTAWGQQYVLSVPSAEYPSIQAALDQAKSLIHDTTTPGDVLIEVSPNTYLERLNLNGIDSTNFRVTLHAVQGQSLTRIDASMINHTLRGDKVKNFTLDGFTVRNRCNPDPSISCPYVRGLNLSNSTGITVQNCYFDTTNQAMWFPINIDDPSFSSEITIVHNTAIGGQGTDPEDPNFRNGQAVNLQQNDYWGPGTCAPSDSPDFDPDCVPIPDQPLPPTGNHKLIVADNVFRTNGSAVRYVLTVTYLPDYYAPGSMSSYSNGSLVMTGNDLVTHEGAGHNILGGRGHIIAGNRFHDSTMGAQIQGASGGIIENNLFVNNGNGLHIGSTPTEPLPVSGNLLVRHNTVVNNLGAGIIYNATGYSPIAVPTIYNNIVAYNNASGIVAVGTTEAFEFGFIPIDFQLARNDVFGNTLKNLYQESSFLSFVGIANPGIATKNYAGTINTGLDLSVNPGFVNLQGRDYSLTKGSPLVNKGVTTRSIPSSDFAKALRDSIPDIGAFEFVTIAK
jgi:parallel beta-helix repeat protein